MSISLNSKLSQTGRDRSGTAAENCGAGTYLASEGEGWLKRNISGEGKYLVREEKKEENVYVGEGNCY